MHGVRAAEAAAERAKSSHTSPVTHCVERPHVTEVLRSTNEARTNHETEDPDASVKANDIRKAIIKKLEDLNDEDLISSVELNDTYLEEDK